MSISVLQQISMFCIFILTGFIIGIIFDIFRVLRKSFKTSDFITYIEDILFWIFVGLITLYSIFKFNNGELRVFIFIAIFIGFLIYILIFSRIFILVNVNIIKFIKNIIIYLLKILLFPINKLKSLIKKPISFITINIRKFFRNIYLNLSNIKIKTKNTNKNTK